LLASGGASKERRNQLTHPAYTKPELLAQGPMGQKFLASQPADRG